MQMGTRDLAQKNLRCSEPEHGPFAQAGFLIGNKFFYFRTISNFVISDNKQ